MRHSHIGQFCSRRLLVILIAIESEESMCVGRHVFQRRCGGSGSPYVSHGDIDAQEW